MKKLIAITLLFLSACLPAHAEVKDSKYYCKCVYSWSIKATGPDGIPPKYMSNEGFCNYHPDIILETRAEGTVKYGEAKGYSWNGNDSRPFTIITEDLPQNVSVDGPFSYFVAYSKDELKRALGASSFITFIATPNWSKLNMTGASTGETWSTFNDCTKI